MRQARSFAAVVACLPLRQVSTLMGGKQKRARRGRGGLCFPVSPFYLAFVEDCYRCVVYKAFFCMSGVWETGGGEIRSPPPGNGKGYEGVVFFSSLEGASSQRAGSLCAFMIACRDVGKDRVGRGRVRAVGVGAIRVGASVFSCLRTYVLSYICVMLAVVPFLHW